MEGRLARPLGGRHARRRHHELQARDEPPRSSANIRLVERFTRIGPDTLLYEFTVDDPTTWTRPWTAAVPTAKSNAPIYEYACHEGNYAMTSILAGARAAEEATAANKAAK